MRKKIKGFEDYAIDTDGNIWSLKNNKWGLRKEYRKLKPWNGSDGYLGTTLYKNNKGFKRKVHRLVLETFIGKCPDGMECCHFDGNPKNNKLKNLRWDTSKNNHADRLRHGNDLRGDKHPLAKLNVFQVRVIKKLINNADLSQYEIAQLFNINRSTISSIKNKVNWAWLD